MKRFYQMAQAANKRFPDGNEPYKMATRLLEEAGEVAREINHFENSGIKLKKYGEPSREDLANELRQTMVALCQIAMYYGVECELNAAVEKSLENSRNEGLI